MPGEQQRGVYSIIIYIYTIIIALPYLAHFSVCPFRVKSISRIIILCYCQIMLQLACCMVSACIRIEQCEKLLGLAGGNTKKCEYKKSGESMHNSNPLQRRREPCIHAAIPYPLDQRQRLLNV